MALVSNRPAEAPDHGTGFMQMNPSIRGIDGLPCAQQQVGDPNTQMAAAAAAVAAAAPSVIKKKKKKKEEEEEEEGGGGARGTQLLLEVSQGHQVKGDDEKKNQPWRINGALRLFPR